MWNIKKLHVAHWCKYVHKLSSLKVYVHFLIYLEALSLNCVTWVEPFEFPSRSFSLWFAGFSKSSKRIVMRALRWPLQNIEGHYLLGRPTWKFNFLADVFRCARSSDHQRRCCGEFLGVQSQRTSPGPLTPEGTAASLLPAETEKSQSSRPHHDQVPQRHLHPCVVHHLQHPPDARPSHIVRWSHPPVTQLLQPDAIRVETVAPLDQDQTQF